MQFRHISTIRSNSLCCCMFFLMYTLEVANSVCLDRHFACQYSTTTFYGYRFCWYSICSRYYAHTVHISHKIMWSAMLTYYCCSGWNILIHRYHTNTLLNMASDLLFSKNIKLFLSTGLNIAKYDCFPWSSFFCQTVCVCVCVCKAQIFSRRLFDMPQWI